MDTVIVSIVIVVIVGLAAHYVYKAKKRGQKCIGCPHSQCGNCCCRDGENNRER